MKFKSDIEVQAGLRDSSGSTGASGQILSSNGNTVSWVPAGSSVASDVQNEVKAGVAINKGQAVYVTSADGTNIIVGLASNTTEATSSKTLGLLNATVAINGFADVVQIGRLAGLNTLAATVGDPVWLGSNGNLIYGLINKPYAPLHLVFIGVVTRVNANNGEIFVNVQNGFELNEIHDVDLKTNVPINGDILGYNGTLWVNKTIAGWLGYTPANQAITIATTAPLSGGGDLSANRTLSISQAGAASNGYLSANDWGIFNGKQNALNGTGFVKASGTTISYDNSTYTPTSRTITINGVTQDLSANQTWTIASGVTSFNTRTGAITLTSGDVTTALGYTPVTDARSITINGVAQDLSANRSWTVTAIETDTLATVTARGASTSTLSYFTGGLGVEAGQLKFNENGIRSWNVQAASGSLNFTSGDNLGDFTFNGGVNVLTTRDSALVLRAMDGGTSPWNYINYVNSAGTRKYYVGTDTSNVFNIYSDDGTGYVYSNTSFRSPIFYDSNNTGYYLDPASTSNLNSVDLFALYSNRSGSAGATINIDNVGSSTWPFLFKTSAVGNDNESGFWVGGAGYPDMRLRREDGNVRALISSWERSYTSFGFTDSTDMRAPIFYDSDNTAYYVNPASTSNIVAMQVNGTLNVAASNAQFWTTTGGGYQRVDARDDSTGARMHWYGVLNNGATSNFRHAWYDGTAYFGITADSAFINFTRSGGGNITTDGSFRAPIFYDSNDTNYYVNPGDASKIRKTDIVAIGSGWYDALNIYSSDATNRWSLLPDAGASNSLRFAYNASEKFRVQTNGSVISLVEHQSPIYYDFNNTAYYLNPDGTSVLNGLTVGGYELVRARTQGNWAGSGVIDNVVGLLSWKNYGSSHVIFDASNGTTPSGTACNTINPQNNWASSYPTLMGWNGANTFGVRVDSARYADSAGVAPNGGNANSFYNVTAGDGNGLRFWTSDSYKISMGVGSLYQYGPVSDYSIKTQMDTGSTGRGFTWGRDGVTPIAALNSTSGDMKIAGNFTANSLQLSGVIEQGNNLARPLTQWGQSGNITGALVIKLPGNTNNYGMIHAVIDVYEYNGNNVCTVIVGGHNWSSQWYNYGAEVVGNTNKQVRVGVKDGRFCIVLGDGSSTWEYGNVVLRKIQNGTYYDNVMDLGGAYSIGIESDSYSWISGNLNTFSSTNVIATSAAYAPIYYDNNNTGYYVDPASTSNFNAANFAGSVNLFGGYGPGSGPGLGFENQNSFIRLAFWGMDFYDWNHGIQLVIDNGYVLANNSMRSPIFYDSNDTTYYLDPASASTSMKVNGNIDLYARSASWSEGIRVRVPGSGVWGGIRFTRDRAGDDGNWAIGFTGLNASDDLTFYGTGAGTSIIKLNLTQGGTLTASGDVVAYSDRRVKDNIFTIQNALDTVTKLRGVVYNRIDVEDKSQKVGVIAQEVLEVLPQVVQEQADGTLGVSYGNITAVLIEAIKEQQTQIEELKELVNKLINKQ